MPGLEKELELSRKFIEVIPAAMNAIRRELRDIASADFTVAQFRVLAHLGSRPMANHELAGSIGLSVAAMSRLVDGLVARKLVARAQSARDRREVVLSLTPAGRKRLGNLQAEARTRLTERFGSLPAATRKDLAAGLRALEEAFGTGLILTGGRAE